MKICSPSETQNKTELSNSVITKNVQGHGRFVSNVFPKAEETCKNILFHKHSVSVENVRQGRPWISWNPDLLDLDHVSLCSALNIGTITIKLSTAKTS